MNLEGSPGFLLMPPKQREELRSIRIWDLHNESYLVLGDHMSVRAFWSKQKDKALFPRNELRYEHLDQILFPIPKQTPPSLSAELLRPWQGHQHLVSQLTKPSAFMHQLLLPEPDQYLFSEFPEYWSTQTQREAEEILSERDNRSQFSILFLIWRYLKLLEILPTSVGTLLY